MNSQSQLIPDNIASIKEDPLSSCSLGSNLFSNTLPAMEEFDSLIASARKGAKQAGMKRPDVARGMKILLDTCVWGGVVQELRAAGHDVVWAGDWPEDPGDTGKA